MVVIPTAIVAMTGLARAPAKGRLFLPMQGC